MRDAPLDVQILSISCSFGENLAKSYVGAPWRVGAPTYGNPGSATAKGVMHAICMILPYRRSIYPLMVWIMCAITVSMSNCQCNNSMFITVSVTFLSHAGPLFMYNSFVFNICGVSLNRAVISLSA